MVGLGVGQIQLVKVSRTDGNVGHVLHAFFHINFLGTTCFDLSVPLNGVITYSTGSTYNRPVGTMATYSCNTGYALNGGSTRTCQLGWTWSGSAPACKGTLGPHIVGDIAACSVMYRIVNDTQHTAICPTLQTIRNGQIVYNYLQRPIIEGTLATYSCNNGYQLTGVTASLCQANGMWSSSPPKCIGKLEKPDIF